LGADPPPVPQDRDSVVHRLGERIKELTALHEAASILRNPEAGTPDMLRRIVAIVPPAFQYPDVTAARLCYGNLAFATPDFAESEWKLEAVFKTINGTTGSLQVIYTLPRPTEDEGPFLAEERRLIDSLVEMVVSMLNARSAAAELQRSQERLELALAAAHMGAWEWDLESDDVTWTTQLQQLVGLEPGEFGGTLDAFRALVEPADLPHLQRAIRLAIGDPRRGDRFETEMRLIRPDGERRWFTSSGRVMRDSAGRARRMIGMAHDVTGLKSLEQQFRQSQKMDALGHLAGSVAHDFNNLLTAIHGYAGFVHESMPGSDERRADVEQIMMAADRAAALTRQLLAFSRRQVTSPRTIDVVAATDAMQSLLGRLLGATIELRVAHAVTPVLVRIDPGQFEQVVMNLAVNARDAMPVGGLLTIETSCLDVDERLLDQRIDLQPGRYAMLAVTDSGTGMSDEVKDRLFEPFFTTKEQGRGTGLGLATVYGIVQQAGGAIWVYSEPGQGATFKVFFPLSESAEASIVADDPLPMARGNETVVIVDDNEAVRTLAARTLEKQGYMALPAASPDDALRIVAGCTGDVHLLLTDVVMPGMLGPELAERVRAVRPGIQVVFITGYTERTIDLEAFVDAAILQKPFTSSSVARVVRATLDRAAR
jgi:PAS domain S-box-containing protein